ncbi:hypothetical protein [Haloarcula pelagica]|uniref:hypothetical protein n=1 Tax=Haloarcula pelagica TaxID=3033389 RepID=UPI0024C3F58C|nr:hypothetical protein [Halomicroarcula sp. YJ-61-S]
MNSDDREGVTVPDRHRRRFLQALAAAGAAGVAGCLGGGDGGDGGGGSGSGSGGSGDGGGGPFPTPPGGAVDGEGGQFVADESAPFFLDSGTVQTTFDAETTPETDLLEGEALGALSEFDLEAHRYTFDATLLGEAGIDPEPGRVLWISGLSLRRVTDVAREGDRVVVDTEFAALNEAIQDGEVGWDAQLGFDAGQTNERFETTTENAAVSEPPARPVTNAALVDVTALDQAGNALGRPEVVQQANREVLELKFTQGNTDYVFGLTPMGNSVRLKAEMTAPSGAPATMRFTGVGEAKAVQAGGRVDYAGGELQQADIDANGLEGEIVIDIAATGTGVEGPTEIPLPGGFAFKHIFMAGPVPITVETSIRLKANINVVSEASATARSRFTFGGDTGFAYDGTSVTPKAKIGTLNINPESADSGALFGQPVSAGFGVAFPRVSVSIFEQILIPYIEVGMAVNTELTWGPVCKSAYIQLVVNGGYDMKILGVELAKFKTTLAEETRRGGEECAGS